MKKYNSPFELERRRSLLAKQNKFDELKDLYKRDLPEISDENTSQLWDVLNRRDDLITNENFMERDKLSWVCDRIDSQAGKILNIGFGSGNLEQIFYSKYHQISTWYGIDISPESVRRIRKKYKTKQYQIGDINDIKFDDSFFQYVIALEVLEHIPPKFILGVLAKIHKILKKNGLLIISVPLNEGLEEMVKNGINPNAHVRDYSPELIQYELRTSGFEIIETRMIYAFKTFYKLKKFIVMYILKNYRQPNGIVIIARKK